MMAWTMCGKNADAEPCVRGKRVVCVAVLWLPLKYRTDRTRELLPYYTLSLHYGNLDEERRPRLGISFPTSESAY
jgi:hypothetical protein